jgi:conjugative transfer region protein (TIGR03748 family)
MQLRLVATVLLGIFLSNSCFAYENATQIGRYVTVSNKPKLSQVNLLSQVVEVRFPQNVQTIGAAMNYLLHFSGYSLVAMSRINSEFKSTLNKPLPIVDRQFGPMSLKNGLATLAGPAFNLIDDPINREVNFSLNTTFLSQNKVKAHGCHH